MYATEDEFYNDVESLTDDEIDELLENKVYPELIKRIDAIF
jgi:predicted phosphoribosyltransferase